MAANCCVAPKVMEGFCGAMEIDTRFAPVTARVAVPVIDPDAAVIVTEPAETPLARPCDPAVSLTVATVPLEELQ